MGRKRHEYKTTTTWVGRTSDEPWDYRSYRRSYTVSVEGKPDLSGSATPVFHGDPAKHNPEDLFLAAVSACHMLSYLALCARQDVEVLQYIDDARGLLDLDRNGGGRFREIELRPRVTLAADTDAAQAEKLHVRAHELCFIANSCGCPIRCEPELEVATVRTGGRA